MTGPYIHQDFPEQWDAPRAVVPIIMDMLHPRSVLDVGCGTGVWLKTFAEAGVTDYLGLDDPATDRKLLKIDEAHFLPKDLRSTIRLGRTFDLVVSLEVAEHLEADFADAFVSTLVTHGNTILFSAAIPGQGGQHHVNEQWPVAWQARFEAHGFYFHDTLRAKIWNDQRIHWWYRQNMFLLKKEKPITVQFPLDAVHPGLFETRLKDHREMMESLQSGRQGLRVSTRIFVQAIWYKLKSLLGL